MLDPRTGDPRLAVNLPAWHEGVLEALRGDLRQPVTIENDVNLAAMAERAAGAAQGADDFVLIWIGVGLGLATISAGGCTAAWRARRARSATCRCPGCRCRRTSATRPPARSSPWSAPQAVRPLAEGYGFAAPTAAAAVRPRWRGRGR